MANILRNSRYPHSMSKTQRAVGRGIVRGTKIAASPTGSIRETRSKDVTAEAWKSVGNSLRQAMKDGSSRR
jgi:hypothetical protein